MTIVLLATFYAAMVGAGYLIELLFGVTGLIPAHRHAMVMSEGLSWNYTTWLNIVFLLLAAVLVARFIRTGGIPMLAIMGGGPDAQEHHHEHHTADEQRSDHEHHRHEHHRHEHHGHGVTDPGEAPSSPPRPDVEP
jgi:hypothetical protein